MAGGEREPDTRHRRVVAGRYRLLDPVGRGGMGIVWRARDEVLGREVAVKEVRAPAGLDGAEAGRRYRRLEREARAAARVSHRGVVTVYDVATEDGRPWIVMELVRGLSLADVLEAEGPLSPQRTAHLGEQVLAALRSAHGAGVLHRDVKPGNVLVANDGRVVLGDFGIARLEGAEAVTLTGEPVGSPDFLAPERAAGREAGPASDLWSLGVMLYLAVEGVSPFRRDTPAATLQAAAEEELPPPRRAGPLAPVLEGLLRKDPAERLPAAEAARMLRVVGAGGTTRTAGAPGAGPGPGPGPGPRPVPVPGAATAPLPHRGEGAGASTWTAPPPAPGPGAGRTSRAGVVVLAVGIAVLVAAFAALGWLLSSDRRTSGRDNGRPVGGTSASAGATGSATPPKRPSAPSSEPAPPSVSPSVPPAPRATAAVLAVRDHYSGSCPPEAVTAPAFTAALAVDRTPATLEYRWATRSGLTSGPGWQAVTFGAGKAASRRLDHTELTHFPKATFRDAVRLEVRGAAPVVSDWVEFSVTCEEEAPTGGTSSGPSASPDASSSAAPDADPAGPALTPQR